MSDRITGFAVVLAEDVNEDIAEQLRAAMRCLNGVADVQPLAGDTQALLGAMRADARWRDALIGLVRNGVRDA
jgi:hypothetical protein